VVLLIVRAVMNEYLIDPQAFDGVVQVVHSALQPSLATALSLKCHHRAINQSLNRIRRCFLDERWDHN
jgi:hypothetical protein